MRTIRVGLIGCGKMGLHHLRAISTIPGAHVVGVADPLASREQLDELLPSDAMVVDDPTVLLESVRPDVVHIVTPPGTHAALARQAVRAGCHVYVEKPFMATVADASEIFELARARGVKVCAGHQYLYEAPAVIARERLSSIGTLVHVESYFSFRMVRRTISPVDQAKDILPHAVYPLVEQLRAGTSCPDASIELKGINVTADGDVYALLRLDACTGLLVATLRGRPIEQFQNLIGTNGSLRADYVTGSVTTLRGPGSGPGVLLTPYRRAYQTLTGATRGVSRLIFGGRGSYPGLRTLIEAFYGEILSKREPALSSQSILDTVAICEALGAALDAADRAAELRARRLIEVEQAALPQVSSARGVVVVTGGTGLLGRRVAKELRHSGFNVRVLARRIPRETERLAGVEYVVADLAKPLDVAVLRDARLVAHCAAETSGGKDDHQRNSIAATRNILTAAALAGIRDVIHVSSLAVLKPGHVVNRRSLDESTPVDADNLERGPYVWGKAESERIAQQFAADGQVRVKIVRPGPLVDYAAFHAPGRLGRELGPWFVAVGGKRQPLGVCDVGTAACVIRSFAEDFAAAPELVNLVESPSPTRQQLADRLLVERPDLKIVWFPALLLRVLSGPLRLLQRVVLGSKKPVDVYSAFASELYRTDVAASVIAKAGKSRVAERTAALEHVS